MIPWLPQLAPLGSEALPRVRATPPVTEIFFSVPLAKNPTHWPSGEKKGLMAPSVPGIDLASKPSSARRKSCWVPPWRATYAS
jgi:hypothetical protein